MLVDEATVTWPDPILGMVAQVNKRGASERITQGIYEIGHFGSSHWLPNFEHWPQLPDKFDRISPLGCFGVCDNVEQIIARCPAPNWSQVLGSSSSPCIVWSAVNRNRMEGGAGTSGETTSGFTHLPRSTCTMNRKSSRSWYSTSMRRRGDWSVLNWAASGASLLQWVDTPCERSELYSREVNRVLVTR